MGILDDAIRQHLDLKRRHGARDAELREIEDEAFGSGEQPDTFANELFNEVSSGVGAEAPPAEGPPQGIGGLGEPDIGGEEPTRLVEPEALHPREPAEEEEAEPSSPAEPVSPPEGLGQIPGQVELPGQDEIPGQERLEEPVEGYQPAREPEPELEAPVEEAGAPEPPSPSESLEELIAEEEPFPEDIAAPHPAEVPPATRPEGREPAPPEAEAIQEEPEPPPEPESRVPEPPPPPPDTGQEPPGRARGRVDVPTEEHPPPGQTGGLPPVPASEPESSEPADEPMRAEEGLPAEEPLADDGPAGGSSGPALYDFETDEDSLVAPGDAPDDEFEALGPAEEEAPYVEEEEPYDEEQPSGTEEPVDEPSTAVRPALEDEEAYEGGTLDPEESYEQGDGEGEGEEGLWFEKGPPQDFDFDE